MTSMNDNKQYRGYNIAVSVRQDCEDRWDFDYTLTAVDGKGEVRQRSHTVNGQMTEEAARVAAIEMARTEIDNVLSMQGG